MPAAVAFPHTQPATAWRRSLSANVMANGASQLYLALAAFVAMPFFLRRMGAESYGLIGFFTVMTAWFQILDAGLSLTLSRESARYRAGVIDAPTLRALTASLEVFFFAVAAVATIVIVVSARAIASSWLRVRQLPVDEVASAVLLMGLTVPLQWVTGLYRGAINGFERQVWLAGFNIVMASLRFGGAAVAIILLGATPLVFFGFQLCVSIVELAVLMVMGRRVMPHVDTGQRRRLRRDEVRGLLGFSASLAFAVTVWVLVTQVDKLILSRILQLADYGVYTLAVVAAGGVLALGAPVAQGLLPRLTKLAAEGAEADVVRLYRASTQLVCLMTAPCALTLALFSTPLIWAWTGEARIAAAAGPILTAYALGNGVMNVGAFAYYLQYAKGDLRLHVIGNAILVVLLVPSMALAALRFGAVGAGYVWLGLNGAYLLGWTPLVHARLVKGLHRWWLLEDVVPVCAAAAAAAGVLRLVLDWPPNRIFDAAQLACVALVSFAAAACASSVARQWMAAMVRRIALRRMPDLA